MLAKSRRSLKRSSSSPGRQPSFSRIRRANVDTVETVTFNSRAIALSDAPSRKRRATNASAALRRAACARPRCSRRRMAATNSAARRSNARRLFAGNVSHRVARGAVRKTPKPARSWAITVNSSVAPCGSRLSLKSGTQTPARAADAKAWLAYDAPVAYTRASAAWFRAPQCSRARQTSGALSRPARCPSSIRERSRTRYEYEKTPRPSSSSPRASSQRDCTQHVSSVSSW